MPAEGIDDVLQETWLAAWVGLKGYDRRARFKAWLFGVALHKCADHHRARGRAPQPATFAWDGEEPAAAATLAEQQQQGRDDPYEAADLRHGVQAALRTLPPEQREVLELYYYAQLTLAEIARVAGRHESTVKYQFYRGHAQIARPLRDLYASLPEGRKKP